MHRIPILLCLLALWACTSKPEEERLREWVAQAVSLAEQGDAGGLLELTASDFRTTPRNIDRRGIKLRLAMALRRFRNGTIHYPRPSVSLSGDDDLAEVELTFLTVRGQTQEGAQGRADPEGWLQGLANKTGVMRIHLWLRLEDGDWLATQARLERFIGTGFRPVR